MACSTPCAAASSRGSGPTSSGIIISVWLDPGVLTATDYDPRVLFKTQREATTKAITKAMRQEPSIEWLLEHQDEVVHYYHQLALDGQL